jgi:hypothetical protein
MPQPTGIRDYEVAFCARVKSWMDALIAQHPEWGFGRVEIEEFGRGNNKRQDLRIYPRDRDTPVLCGEVKMPGTPEGRSPYDPALMNDAQQKADNIQSQYFFTWNVNWFVLFDRSRWQVALIERRVRDWDLGLDLRDAAGCRNPEVERYISEKFLPEFLALFADIVSGRLQDWQFPPHELFIQSLHSHLEWPVQGTADYMAEQSAADATFAARLQAWMAGEMGWTFDPKDPEEWAKALQRAARTLCYVFCNRAIFYDALRARFSERLDALTMPQRSSDPERVYKWFRRHYERAVRESGDYEPIFYPQVSDWAGTLVFASAKARDGWRGLFTSLHEYNFREIPSDVLGHIFQKLVSPEERQRFGQFFTHDDIIDVINAFCIRRAGDLVLDPACGSGSFLVRAYHRKAWLSEQASGGQRHTDHGKTHQELLREIFGCDIALFPAHLATLNLAARQITNEENYPAIARRNFFDAAADRDSFCLLPGRRIVTPDGSHVYEPREVALPDLDAVVGNPPYIRQELVPRLKDTKPHRGEPQDVYQARVRLTKEYMAGLCEEGWPGLKMPARSDLHCYFWPVATHLLREGGYFGFLTSSSWLDVEYGFGLQAWILDNFRLVAVIESVNEPWFEDARIKTAATIIQRCADREARENNIVKFVRLQSPLSEILGEHPAGDEGARQRAAERLRSLIEKTKTLYTDDRMRIMPVPQRQLWEEGVRASQILGKAALAAPQGEEEEDSPESEEAGGMAEVAESTRTYAAGKWGRFLRAPDLYFRIMRDYGHRFAKLGEIVEVRRGITSGCDAFFMPRDVTSWALAKASEGKLWLDLGLVTHCPRKAVESGKVRIVRAGDNTLHPIEAEYLRPEVHSLMQIDRPIVRAADLDRVALWVDRPLEELGGTYAAKYIRWGSRQTFASEKSKSVRVPERSTCAARPLWYNITGVSTGVAFWPMSQQYRHIIPANPERLLCNHNLFYVKGNAFKESEAEALIAVLNSTLVGLIKTYYGRYAGTEGNLKTEVVDVDLMDVPDPRGVSSKVLDRLRTALRSMQEREVGRMVEEEFMACHTAEHVKELAQRPISLSQELRQPDRRELDDAVLEMLGVDDCDKRRKLLEELYLETARHYRQIRIVEVQKMEQRGRASGGKFSAADLALSIWHSLPPEVTNEPVLQWLSNVTGEKERVEVPEGKAEPHGKSHLFEPRAVVYRSGSNRKEVVYSSIEQATLAVDLAEMGIRGHLMLPVAPMRCSEASSALKARTAQAAARFKELAGMQTGTPGLQQRTVDLLQLWFIHGRPQA